MNWGTIRPAILALIKSLVDLPQVVWADQSQPYIDPTARGIVRLSIKSVVSQGWDDIKPEYSSDNLRGQEIHDRVAGLRNFTLSMRCESFEQEDSRAASTYLEQARDRLKRRSSTDALNAINCAFVSSANTVDISSAVDGRMQSIAVLDLMMRAEVNEVDPLGYGYIESVDILPLVGIPIPLKQLGSNGASIPLGVP